MRLAGRAEIALSALALLSACAAPQEVAPAVKPSHVVLQRRPAEGQSAALALSKFQKERDCNGPAYAAARRYAGDWLDTVVSVPTDARRIAGARENGQFRLRLAQAAARKGCVEAARETYAEVNEIFSGEPYSALRRRADVGLNALSSGPAAGP